ncbi:MAG: hypothetical protein FJ279_01785 [Planctomycetes bacterium]|nr:hypothetical protein [Planctomycetota bacterium]
MTARWFGRGWPVCWLHKAAQDAGIESSGTKKELAALHRTGATQRNLGQACADGAASWAPGLAQVRARAMPSG